MWRTYKNGINKLFTYDKWNIGHTLLSPDEFIRTKGIHSPVKWMPEDSLEYRADPFAFMSGGKLYLMFEELSFWKGKGSLALTEGFNKASAKEVKGINGKAGHLSYPFVFEVLGNRFCIPETSDKDKVDLYQLDPDRPHKLTWKRTLLSAAKYVDSCMLWFQDKFWLFTSKAQEYGELYIFWANSLEEDFVAHAMNPIKVRPNQSRAAGALFFVNGYLYMPTQNPQRCYGGSVTINLVKTLTTCHAEIEECFEVPPVAPYHEGIHTVNFVSGYLILDGKRKVRSFLAPVKKTFKMLGSV